VNEKTPNKHNDCRFCDLSFHEIVEENEHAVSFLDAYPVSEFHSLFVPRRHALTFFDLTHSELQSIHRLITSQRKRILEKDPTVEGFNIGWNCGEAAAQSVFHAHCHLIPRKKGVKPNLQDSSTKPYAFLNPWMEYEEYKNPKRERENAK
jgi:diadenosine tetraphosphate (Ap4A) HIT family hydrolase